MSPEQEQFAAVYSSNFQHSGEVWKLMRAGLPGHCLRQEKILALFPPDTFRGREMNDPCSNISSRHITNARQTQSVLFCAQFTLFAPNKCGTLWIIRQRATTACTGSAENSPERLWESGRQQSVSRAVGRKAGCHVRITEHTQAPTPGLSS